MWWWFLLKCQIQGMFYLGDPQVNLKRPIFQSGKVGLDRGLQQLTVFCSFGLVNTSESLLFLPTCCGWIFFFFPPSGTNLLSSRCVSSMKALHWQRTPGCRAGLTDVALSIIRVILRGAWAFFMRAEAGWLSGGNVLGHLCPEITAAAAATV